jgi:GntR family transcriptional regulator, transcriptional repressor for pyruvate dehydrogenase complex
VDPGTAFGRVKVEHAYEQLANVVRKRIETGALCPGDRLPSESKLAHQTGVSRSTVREALRKLEQAGFIERASPKVMVVRGANDGDSHREVTAALRRRNVTFHHLHEALLTIEPELTRFAAERADDADITSLRENVRAQEENIENFPEWCRLDQEFHLAIAEMSSNPALIVTRAPITSLLLPVLYRFMDSSSLTTHALTYHRRMLAEIEARDPELAAAVTRRHINDFRTAWEKAGLDFNLPVVELGDEGVLRHVSPARADSDRT